MTPVENDIRCLKYEVKRLKKRPVYENIVPAAFEERSVESPIDHSEEIESLKNSVNELKEALCYLKHEIIQRKSAPVQEPVVTLAPIDLTPVDNVIRC